MFVPKFLVPAIALGLILLAWAILNFGPKIEQMRPGLDNRPATSVANTSALGALVGRYFSPAKVQVGAEWPGFRGATRNAQVSDSIALVDRLSSPPSEVWRIELGEGHAAAAVAQGIVYVLDYAEASGRDVLRAFSLADGQEFWQVSYPNPMKRNHGFSRSIPSIAQGVVVAIGPQGRVIALDAVSGQELWTKHLSLDYGSAVPLWYGAQCPLIDHDTVILATAGTATLMVGLDLKTGQELWRCPNPEAIQLSHSSIIKISYGGQEHYVYSGLGGMVGVSTTGTLLWQLPLNMAVVAPSPVFIPPNRLYQTAGYGAGSLLIELTQQNEGFEAKMVAQYSPREALACEQQTPLYYDGHLFAVLPKDAGPGREEFVCADAMGKIVWSSGESQRFGLGPYLIADGKFLILGDTGLLTMATASTKGWNLLGQVKVLDGVDAWGPPAMVDGYLLVRDSRTLVCLDLAKKR